MVGYSAGICSEWELAAMATGKACLRCKWNGEAKNRVVAVLWSRERGRLGCTLALLLGGEARRWLAGEGGARVGRRRMERSALRVDSKRDRGGLSKLQRSEGVRGPSRRARGV